MLPLSRSTRHFQTSVKSEQLQEHARYSSRVFPDPIPMYQQNNTQNCIHRQSELTPDTFCCYCY